MLRLAKCRTCNQLLYSSDSHTLKQLMASHMSKSHKIDYGFVAKIPLRDFEDFVVVTIRSKREADFIKNLLKQPNFWHFYRNFNKLAVARLDSLFFPSQLIGEIKPFCNPN